MAGNSKIWKRIKRSLVTFFVLVVLGWVLTYQYGNPILESKIRNAFARATAGRYDLNFDEIYISYKSKGITIKNLRVAPKADSLKALQHTTLLELHCKDVSIYGIDFVHTFFGKDFAADELSLQDPSLIVLNNDSIKPKSLRSKKEKDLGSFQLNKIRITNAQALVKRKSNDQLLYETKNLNLFVDGFGLSTDLIPLYSHFSLESIENSIGIFPNQAFKVGKLFMAGNSDYTGLNASEFNISEVDSTFRKSLKIPDEINFSLEGISLESQSLADLIEQLTKGNIDKILISQLLLIRPNVSVETKRKSNEELETSEKLKRISKKIQLPSIDKIGVLDGEFVWMEPGEKKPVLKIDDIHIMAKGLRPRWGKKIPLQYVTAEVHTGKTTFTYPKSDYSFKAQHIHYKSVTDSLKIEHFSVLPHKSIDSFYMDKKWRIDRFEFHCDTVHIEKLNVDEFAFKNQFNPEKIVFRNPNIKAYTDKRLNHDPNFIKPFPLQKLREIDGDYNIQEILFVNGTATYSEKVAESPGLGKLNISNANLRITNLKNKVEITDTAHVYFDCSLGGGSYAEMKIDVPLYGNNEIQYAKGMIKNLPFKQLNSITENTVYMGFADGKLDSCWFNFKAVNGKSEGNSVFYYNNLKVKIYKLVFIPAYNNKILLNKGFMSIVANLLINKNNPTEEGYSMPGKLAFERDKLKGPLNFWIKTIMTGLMNTVIDDISELKDLQEEVKSLKSSSQTGILSKIKSNPIKKTIRRQAREARKATRNADEKK